MTYGFHLGLFQGLSIIKLRKSMPLETITQQRQED